MTELQSAEESICISFQDNRLLAPLFGEQDKNLSKIEKQLGVSVSSRGNMVSITGEHHGVYVTEAVLKNIYKKLQNGMEVSDGEVDALIRMLADSMEVGSGAAKVAAGNKKPEVKRRPEVDLSILDNIRLKTQKKDITPYSKMQADYMKELLSKELVFAHGPAGTGKTYLAVAAAVSMFMEGVVDRIILSRPAVEAGEKLGFLPGDIKEKVDPYLRPLYDALYDMLPPEKVVHHLETGQIEIAPLAFMRGRTLRHSYIILDEAQNTTPVQMKMFLTRLGEGSRMAVLGDLSQVDLPKDAVSGFRDATETLKDIEELAIVRLGDADIVRHSLTAKIVQAYDKGDK